MGFDMVVVQLHCCRTEPGTDLSERQDMLFGLSTTRLFGFLGQNSQV